jgi:hypothetical protein
MSQEILTLIASVKAAVDIARGMKALSDEVDSKEKASKLYDAIIEIQSQALSLQAQYQELLESNKNLTNELMEVQKWNQVESSYELTKLSNGVFVYSYKVSNQNIEPAHYACPKCFQSKKKSILQPLRRIGNNTVHKCPECKDSFHIPLPADTPPEQSPTMRMTYR